MGVGCVVGDIVIGSIVGGRTSGSSVGDLEGGTVGLIEDAAGLELGASVDGKKLGGELGLLDCVVEGVEEGIYDGIAIGAFVVGALERACVGEDEVSRVGARDGARVGR
jgi:hypothetical protein